jgi:hypothetical protein
MYFALQSYIVNGVGLVITPLLGLQTVLVTNNNPTER